MWSPFSHKSSIRSTNCARYGTKSVLCLCFLYHCKLTDLIAFAAVCFKQEGILVECQLAGFLAVQATYWTSFNMSHVWWMVSVQWGSISTNLNMSGMGGVPVQWAPSWTCARGLGTCTGDWTKAEHLYRGGLALGALYGGHPGPHTGTLLWTDRMSDTTDPITFPHLLWRAVNIIQRDVQYFSFRVTRRTDRSY